MDPRGLYHFPKVRITSPMDVGKFSNVHILWSSHRLNGKPISNTVKKWYQGVCYLENASLHQYYELRFDQHVYPIIWMSHLPTLWRCQKTLVLIEVWQSTIFFSYSTLCKKKKKRGASFLLFIHVNYLLTAM